MRCYRKNSETLKILELFETMKTVFSMRTMYGSSLLFLSPVFSEHTRDAHATSKYK
jgi:hypothetical protein